MGLLVAWEGQNLSVWRRNPGAAIQVYIQLWVEMLSLGMKGSHPPSQRDVYHESWYFIPDRPTGGASLDTLLNCKVVLFIGNYYYSQIIKAEKKNCLPNAGPNDHCHWQREKFQTNDVSSHSCQEWRVSCSPKPLKM